MCSLERLLMIHLFVCTKCQISLFFLRSLPRHGWSCLLMRLASRNFSFSFVFPNRVNLRALDIAKLALEMLLEMKEKRQRQRRRNRWNRLNPFCTATEMELDLIPTEHIFDQASQFSLLKIVFRSENRRLRGGFTSESSGTFIWKRIWIIRWSRHQCQETVWESAGWESFISRDLGWRLNWVLVCQMSDV